MLKTREILRLKHEVGLSLREIGKACDCGKSTVSEILSRAEKAGITWPISLSDKQLMSMIYPPIEGKSSPPEPNLEYIFCEMKRKNVTLMLLWEEYKRDYPDGIMYTQFCERYRNFKANNKISMHKEHKAGEEVEIVSMSWHLLSERKIRNTFILPHRVYMVSILLFWLSIQLVYTVISLEKSFGIIAVS